MRCLGALFVSLRMEADEAEDLLGNVVRIPSQLSIDLNISEFGIMIEKGSGSVSVLVLCKTRNRVIKALLPKDSCPSMYDSLNSSSWYLLFFFFQES